MKWRRIQRDLITDPSFATLPGPARLLYFELITFHADAHGRSTGHPAMLTQVLTGNAGDTARALQLLDRSGLILWYAEEKRAMAYVQICNWDRDQGQRAITGRAESRIPRPEPYHVNAEELFIDPSEEEQEAGKECSAVSRLPGTWQEPGR